MDNALVVLLITVSNVVVTILAVLVLSHLASILPQLRPLINALFVSIHAKLALVIVVVRHALYLIVKLH